MSEGLWKLPKDWKWVKLENVARNERKTVTPSATPQSHFNYIELENLSAGQWEEPQENIVPGGKIRSTCVEFKPRQVLYTKLRPYLNKVVLCSRGGVASAEFIPLTPRQELADAPYLAWYLRSPEFVAYASRHTTGSRQPRVAQTAFWSALVPLPRLEEQRVIVAKIEALFDRIREAKRLRAEASSDANILMASALADVFRDLGSSWPVSTIKELQDNDKLQIYGGGTPSKKNTAFWTGTLPWVSPKDMKRWEIDDTEDHISDEAVRVSSVKLLPTGTVLVVVRGMILERAWPIAIARINLTVNQDMKGLLPSDGLLLPEFLAYALKSRESEVLQKIEIAGHGTRRLRTATLESLLVPIPSLSEQKRIVVYLNQVAETVATLKQQQEQTFTELLQAEQSVLDRAFRGEL